MAVGQFQAFVASGVPLNADTPEAATARQLLASGVEDVAQENAASPLPVEEAGGGSARKRSGRRG